MARASSIAARALCQAAALAGALFTGDPALADAPGPGASAPAETRAAEAARPDPGRAVRIAELRAAITRDRERLKELVSEPERPGGLPLYEQPELREIAERLPELERELRSFEEPGAPLGADGR